MDDLYENLDNFNEGATIAALQNDNKIMKSKLDEYASLVDKLHKDLDSLSSQYKNLEVNYSSLLKTAKAEIERKTQIITNLNLEKDKLVLTSFHNRKVAPFNRNRSQNFKADPCYKHDKTEVIETEKGRKSSTHIENNRIDPDNSSKDKSTSSNPDIKHKLLNISNDFKKHVDPRVDKRSELKDTVMQYKIENDVGARIRNRRKSMPAGSFEMETFPVDADEITNSRISEELTKYNVDRRHTDQKFSNRSHSRMSGNSSLEDRNSGYHESISDTNRSRKGRYDFDRIDRHYAKDKSSYRYKRNSPDRFQTEYKYQENTYSRHEHDMRRIVETPPYDKDQWQRNHEPQLNYQRNHPKESRRLLRNEEIYPMKRKVQHNYCESDSKRMKIDPNTYRFHEEQRLRNESDILSKKYVENDSDNCQFMSCESPDYHYPDVSNHQIKEIKFNATTKLDDPRISSMKYIFKKNNGKASLSSVEARNIDIIDVDKSAWGINTVRMPDALVQRPSLENERTLKEIHTKSKTPILNVSNELSEFREKQVDREQEELNSRKIIMNTKVPLTIKSKSIEDSTHNISSKKPKESIDKKRSEKDTKKSLKEVVTKTLKDKSKKKSHDIKPCSNEESLIESNKCEKVGKGTSFQCPSDLKDTRKCTVAKGIVEVDLELSDDDNKKPENITKYIGENSSPQEDKKESSESLSSESTMDTKKTSLEPKSDTLNANCDKSNKLPVTIKVAETSVDEIADNGKKSKGKKKSKYKGTKEENVCKELSYGLDKKKHKKEKNKETKTKVMKTKFIEPFDDSNSLISPEDLGLTPVSAPSTGISNKSLPFLEDAQDAVDLDANKTTKDLLSTKNTLIEIQKQNSEPIENKKIKNTVVSHESINNSYPVHKMNDLPSILDRDSENIHQNLRLGIGEKDKDVMKTVLNKIDIENSYKNREPEIRKKDNDMETANKEGVKNIYKNVEPGIKKKDKNVVETVLNKVDIENIVENREPEISDKGKDVMETVVNKLDIENIYENLETEISENDKDVVKTVIISSGVQPQLTLDIGLQGFENPLLMKTESHHVVLKGLATSTPNKICQTNVEFQTTAKETEATSNSTNKLANTENSSALDNSDYTLDSQMESMVVPDVRIFVKRRRKTIKK